jgi:hydrogenase maturation factor
MSFVQQTHRYALERDIENVTSNSAHWLKERFKEVLESDKDATRKCDYLGYSILGIDSKVQLLEDEIKELRFIKDKLKCAKELALEVGAELFSEYGINKLEGAGISSITLYQPLQSPKLSLTITNEMALIEAGFVKKVVDTEAIKEAYLSGQYLELIHACCEMELHAPTNAKRLKINKRRAVNNLTSLSTGEEQAS